MFSSWGRRRAVKELAQANSINKNDKISNSDNNKKEALIQKQNINLKAIKKENSSRSPKIRRNSPNIKNSPKHENTIEKDLNEEYERKIRVLSQCLEEKAEENITLHEKINKQDRRLEFLQKEVNAAKDLEFVVSELNNMLREKDNELESFKSKYNTSEKQSLEYKQLSEEFERRISVLSSCLEEMAQENLGLHSTNPKINPLSSSSPDVIQLDNNTNTDKNTIKPSPSVDTIKEECIPSSHASSGDTIGAKLKELTLKKDLEKSESDRLFLESQLNETKQELEDIEDKLQQKEKRIIQLNSKLIDAVNKKHAFEESNDLYEEKLKSLEKELTDNLHQEGIRRQEAEYVASKLKKKVAELQFLLDERDQDSDSSYYSEEDEEF